MNVVSTRGRGEQSGREAYPALRPEARRTTRTSQGSNTSTSDRGRSHGAEVECGVYVWYADTDVQICTSYISSRVIDICGPFIASFRPSAARIRDPL